MGYTVSRQYHDSISGIVGRPPVSSAQGGDREQAVYCHGMGGLFPWRHIFQLHFMVQFRKYLGYMILYVLLW